MKRLLLQAPTLLLGILGTVALAQEDIYQNDAYSVEEMCAQEAEQNDSSDYSQAYDECLSKNREDPHDQTDQDTASTAEEQTEPGQTAPPRDDRKYKADSN